MYNLIIVTPDQMRRDYLGCYGNMEIRTPGIDGLSEEGITFENCYCAAPLCAPSRISFATSTYFSEHNHRNYWSAISADVPNLVMQLKKRGYRTGMYGKNHLFLYDDLNRVWDGLDEICLGNYDGHEKYTHSWSSFQMEPDHRFNITGRLTDEAIAFMKENREGPFFTWINYQDPHPAFTCPPPYDTMYDPDQIVPGKEWYYQTGSETGAEGPEESRERMPCRESVQSPEPVRNEVWRKHSEMDLCTDEDYRNAVAHYMGQITYVDSCVDRLLKYLRESGLEKNTVVLFFSDHGELLGSHHMMHKIPVFYDCLTRIPVILKYPGCQKGVRFRGLVEEVDLVPTLLELLSVNIPDTMCGRSLYGSLKEGKYEEWRETILCEAGGGAPTYKEPVKGLKLLAPHAPTSFGPGAMVRKGNYKLSIYHDDQGELYRIDSDPEELHNLYNDPEYFAVRQELTLILLKRILGVKVRETGGIEWNFEEYGQDVRFEPLEMAGSIRDVRFSG